MAVERALTVDDVIDNVAFGVVSVREPESIPGVEDVIKVSVA